MTYINNIDGEDKMLVGGVGSRGVFGHTAVTVHDYSLFLDQYS